MNIISFLLSFLSIFSVISVVGSEDATPFESSEEVPTVTQSNCSQHLFGKMTPDLTVIKQFSNKRERNYYFLNFVF